MFIRTALAGLILFSTLWLAACASPAQSAGTPAIPPTRSTLTPQPAPGSGLIARFIPPTPTCNALTLTPAMTEGPYYKQNPPERLTLIEPGTNAPRLILIGYVLTIDCKPVPGARVDFWQADENGQYDNTGYKLRGYQLTDDAGHYYLETVVPGIYTGRTRHIHVKVQAPNRPGLTTQLFFPNEPSNAQDSIFDQKLVLSLRTEGQVQVGTFNFVLSTP